MGARRPAPARLLPLLHLLPDCHMGLKKNTAVEGTTDPFQQLPAQKPSLTWFGGGEPQAVPAQAALSREGGRRARRGPASPGTPGPGAQRLTEVRGRRPALRPRVLAAPRRGSCSGLRPGPGAGTRGRHPRSPGLPTARTRPSHLRAHGRRGQTPWRPDAAAERAGPPAAPPLSPPPPSAARPAARHLTPSRGKPPARGGAGALAEGQRRRRRLRKTEWTDKARLAAAPLLIAPRVSSWKRTSSNQPRSVPSGRPPREGAGRGGGQPGAGRRGGGRGRFDVSASERLPPLPGQLQARAGAHAAGPGLQ